MKFSKSIFAIDSHTMGEPTRVVIAGIPFIPGNSMIEKKIYLEKELDYVRKLLMLEPRGLTTPLLRTRLRRLLRF